MKASPEATALRPHSGHLRRCRRYPKAAVVQVQAESSYAPSIRRKRYGHGPVEPTNLAMRSHSCPQPSAPRKSIPPENSGYHSRSRTRMCTTEMETSFARSSSVVLASSHQTVCPSKVRTSYWSHRGVTDFQSSRWYLCNRGSTNNTSPVPRHPPRSQSTNSPRKTVTA